MSLQDMRRVLRGWLWLTVFGQLESRPSASLVVFFQYYGLPYKKMKNLQNGWHAVDVECAVEIFPKEIERLSAQVSKTGSFSLLLEKDVSWAPAVGFIDVWIFERSVQCRDELVDNKLAVSLTSFGVLKFELKSLSTAADFKAFHCQVYSDAKDAPVMLDTAEGEVAGISVTTDKTDKYWKLRRYPTHSCLSWLQR